MSKDNKPLSPIDKSELLYGQQATPELANATAEAYAAEKRYCEAADFYHRADNKSALLKLADLAEAAGNGFLFARIERALHQPFEADRWRTLGQAAQAAGKDGYAQMARQKTGDTAEPNES